MTEELKILGDCCKRLWTKYPEIKQDIVDLYDICLNECEEVGVDITKEIHICNNNINYIIEKYLKEKNAD